MNKSELAEKVAESAGMSKAQAGDAVNAVFDAIQTAMSKGDSVRLPGFGSFSVADVAAGMARNPATGEMFHRPASKRPKFKAGKGLKDAVNS